MPTFTHQQKPSDPTVLELLERNKQAGFHWADPKTIKYFGTTFQKFVFVDPNGICYFVTGERHVNGQGAKMTRQYHVRRAWPNGFIDTPDLTRIFDDRVQAFRNARYRSTDCVCVRLAALEGKTTERMGPPTPMPFGDIDADNMR